MLCKHKVFYCYAVRALPKITRTANSVYVAADVTDELHGQIQRSARCRQQSGPCFKRSDLFLCFVYPQSACVGSLGEKASPVLTEYVKYNRDLTRKLPARMLWIWELAQTCAAARKHHIWEYNLRRRDTSKVRVETQGES